MTKLIEHHRRHNFMEPTRSQLQSATITPGSKTYSTIDPIDVEVGEISKDADNLGDWLYNQFFKTIENQVINSTNEDKLTRRSGQGPKKPKRIKPTNRMKKALKKKNKKANLKKKVVRISEDHSIFDRSSSSSSSDSDTDSSADSSSNDKSKYSDSKEHAHKKIVMYRKKPKGPLPSFIFLPNMDTPYYPPLGLPPPPVAPMYPAIPIPPMLPVFPCIVTTTTSHKTTEKEKEDETKTTSSVSATQTTKTIDKTDAPSVPEASDVPDDNVVTEAPNVPDSSDIPDVPEKSEDSTSTSQPDTLRDRLRKKKKIPRVSKNYNSKLKGLEYSVTNLPPKARQKMLYHLRQKMKNALPNMHMPPWTKVNNLVPSVQNEQISKPEMPILEDNILPEELILKNSDPSQIQNNDALTDNVDFKYISQLIHKGNVTNKFDLPPIEYKPNNLKNPKDMYESFNTPFSANDMRRKINRLENTNIEDAYFTKLGQQIASLIRKLDAEKQVQIEVEKTKPTYTHSPYFNYNSPRSFWERSVRSPLKVINSQQNKFEYLIKSNELLYNIENKVEVLASTSQPLDLREMENIVNMMEIAKRDIQDKDRLINLIKSDISNKINLWPKELQRSNDVTPSVIKETKYIDPNKNSIGELPLHQVQKIFVWPNEAQRKNVHHINHIHNPNNRLNTFNNHFGNNEKMSGKKYITFNNNVPSSDKSDADLPFNKNRINFMPSTNQINRESTLFKREPNSRIFVQKPSYFDSDINQYGFFN